MQPEISKSPFGILPDGRAAVLYTLTNSSGLVVKITDFGGIITAIHTPDRDGNFADIVLGFDSLAPYVGNPPYFGALIGRYANRIRAGRFALDGKVWQLSVNNGTHHLHGGPDGFHRVLWQAVPFQRCDAAGLVLSYRSADGEQGYPGTLDVVVIYELNSANELVMHFNAVTDKATPLNLTQHTYFNLAGRGDILGHELMLAADAFTPIDSTLIPTGEVAPVEGTAFDFRAPRLIGARMDDEDEQLRRARGYDHNFVLNKPVANQPTLAARVREPASGRVLELLTDQPGVQFYSGNFLDGSQRGKGRVYGCRSGFCLEPQHFPDAPNQPSFPNTILRPGAEYTALSAYRFLVEK